ncbi:hypothetical protein [Dolichospermum sp. UHCC 0259]|uniref:hypothetical protein n=1 Tax=Dolichospermum sp. UHCC 0259 TaxID=2590010 RepID=UPI001446D512|nr:hypothetical protein [Dolichospermum sp. UHCC 0259]MTJ48466.1 hypothetical protein [Dolichospermum sp. UHCC 0259]
MNQWKITESLPNKIVTQEDTRIKGSWIAPLLMVLPGLVPIWLGTTILPATVVCQPVSVSSLQCQKKSEFLGITIPIQTYTQPTSKPRNTTQVIPGNTILLSIGLAWVGGLGSILLLSAWYTVTLTTCTIDRTTSRISITRKTALRQRINSYLISELQELMLKLPSSTTTIENFATAAVEIKLTTHSGKSLLFYAQSYDQLPEIDKLLVNLRQLLNIPYKLVLDLGLEVWKFESNGKITVHKVGKYLAEYAFKDIAKVETETLEEGKNANNIYRYRVNLVTTNGKRLGISEFISEDFDINHTSYAKIRANQVSDRLRQFINFPGVP